MHCSNNLGAASQAQLPHLPQTYHEAIQSAQTGMARQQAKHMAAHAIHLAQQPEGPTASNRSSNRRPSNSQMGLTAAAPAGLEVDSPGPSRGAAAPASPVAELLTSALQDLYSPASSPDKRRFHSTTPLQKQPAASSVEAPVLMQSRSQFAEEVRQSKQQGTHQRPEQQQQQQRQGRSLDHSCEDEQSLQSQVPQQGAVGVLQQQQWEQEHVHKEVKELQVSYGHQQQGIGPGALQELRSSLAEQMALLDMLQQQQEQLDRQQQQAGREDDVGSAVGREQQQERQQQQQGEGIIRTGASFSRGVLSYREALPEAPFHRARIDQMTAQQFVLEGSAPHGTVEGRPRQHQHREPQEQLQQLPRITAGQHKGQSAVQNVETKEEEQQQGDFTMQEQDRAAGQEMKGHRQKEQGLFLEAGSAGLKVMPQCPNIIGQGVSRWGGDVAQPRSNEVWSPVAAAGTPANSPAARGRPWTGEAGVGKSLLGGSLGPSCQQQKTQQMHGEDEEGNVDGHKHQGQQQHQGWQQQEQQRPGNLQQAQQQLDRFRLDVAAVVEAVSQQDAFAAAVEGDPVANRQSYSSAASVGANTAAAAASVGARALAGCVANTAAAAAAWEVTEQHDSKGATTVGDAGTKQNAGGSEEGTVKQLSLPEDKSPPSAAAAAPTAQNSSARASAMRDGGCTGEGPLPEVLASSAAGSATRHVPAGGAAARAAPADEGEMHLRGGGVSEVLGISMDVSGSTLAGTGM